MVASRGQTRRMTDDASDVAKPAPTRIRGRIGRVGLDLSVEGPPPRKDTEGTAKDGGGDWTLNWQTMIAIVGAAAALGVWINVVGGAVLWARFDAAALPASQIVGIVPNTTLIGIGIRALVLPVLVGVVAVGLLYVSRSAGGGADSRPSATAAEEVRLAIPGRVLLTLAVLAVVTDVFAFGGHIEPPERPEYVYAWAIVSSFLVFGAVTYEPVNRRLRRRRGLALLLMGVVGFLVIWLTGVRFHHGQPAAIVATLAFAAGLLAWVLPPGEHVLGVSAGTLLIGLYLALGLWLFLKPGRGDVDFAPGDQAPAFATALLMSSLALLFLCAVARRTHGSFGRPAAIMFAVVAAWGGIVGYLRERNPDPRFELTAMLRKPGTGSRREARGAAAARRVSDRAHRRRRPRRSQLGVVPAGGLADHRRPARPGRGAGRRAAVRGRRRQAEAHRRPRRGAPARPRPAGGQWRLAAATRLLTCSDGASERTGGGPLAVAPCVELATGRRGRGRRRRPSTGRASRTSPGRGRRGSRR
jgi:hypothetical protein